MTHVHFIGIGGTGLSAIARVLLESGYTVSGSDRQASPLAQSLRESGVDVYLGHREENVKGADLVIRSSAVTEENVEVQAARRAGIPVLKRSDFLGQLMEGRTGIAVAGTHGKTTTTAMIAWMLTALGQDPTFIIGGVARNLGANAHAGHGTTFVIEADEYDRMFLGLAPEIAVVTNIEHDHPDCFPTLQDYSQAFAEFVGRVREGGSLLACGDDFGASNLARSVSGGSLQTLLYGLEEAAYDYRAVAARPNERGGFDFQAKLPGEQPVDLKVSLQVPGLHNVQNALAAVAVAHRLGLSVEQAASALAEFAGTGRRFEILGEAAGVTVIDDYGHHPTEIRATLAAARARYPQAGIWAVWQPHTYTRTQALFGKFASAFGDADHVLVTEVYPAREPVSKDFSARQIVDAMRQVHHPDAHFVPGLADAVQFLLDHLSSGDVLLVFSAGDADQVSAKVLYTLKQRSLRVQR